MTLSPAGHDASGAVLPADGAVAAWNWYNGVNNIVDTARNGGGLWGAPVTLSDVLLDANTPALSSDGTTIVWYGADGSNGVGMWATRASAGVWGAPVIIALEQNGVYTPQVSADGTVAVWLGVDGGENWIIHAARAAGGIWGGKVSLSLDGNDAWGPQVSADGTLAVWSRFNGTESIIQCSRFTGDAWESAVDLSVTGGSARAPSVSANGTVVVWSRSDGTNTIIQSVRFSGGTWSAPVNVSAAGQDAVTPQISADGNVAIWARSNGTNEIIQVSRFGGGAWRAPVDLSSGGQNAGAPQLSGVGAVATWYRSDSLVPQSIIQARTYGAGIWGTTADLSVPGPYAFDPRVSNDGSVVAWSRSDGTNFRVEAAHRAPTVLSISPAMGPVAGGTPVTITGTGFTTGSTVAIGGSPATSVVWFSATSITAIAPAGSPGAADVVVTNPDTSTGTMMGGFSWTNVAATATLGGLGPTYDGTQKSATCATTPLTLTYSIAYSNGGSGTGRINAGSYDVLCTITQAGYMGSASGTLVIAKAVQSITFGGQAAQTLLLGGTFALNPVATASSALAVAYSTQTPATCAIAGATVTMLAIGACRIAADQAGNGNVNPALQRSQDIALNARTSFSGSAATGTGTITATFSGGGPNCTYGQNTAFIPLTGATQSPPTGTAPYASAFPFGLFALTLTGCAPGSTVVLSITYPSAPGPGAVYQKYGPTPGSAVAHWYVIPATFSANTVTLTLVDGDIGDDDLVANGTIVDQGGPAVPAAPPALQAIPTLSEAALTTLALLLALGGSLQAGGMARTNLPQARPSQGHCRSKPARKLARALK